LENQQYKVPSTREKMIRKLTITNDEEEIEKELVSDKVIASNDDPSIFQMSRGTNRKFNKSFEKVYRKKKSAVAASVVLNRKHTNYNFSSVKNSIDSHALPGIKLKQTNKRDICV
jgi:hypothetical protein